MNEYHFMAYGTYSSLIYCVRQMRTRSNLGLTTPTNIKLFVGTVIWFLSFFMQWHYFAEKLAYFQRLARVFHCQSSKSAS